MHATFTITIAVDLVRIVAINMSIGRVASSNARHAYASPLNCRKPHENPLSSRNYIRASVTAVTINSDGGEGGGGGGIKHSETCFIPPPPPHTTPNLVARYSAAAGWIDFSPPDVTTNPACAWWLNTVPISVPVHVLLYCLLHQMKGKRGI